MKLSVEAKVAAVVATGFIALAAAVIGQEGSGTQTGPPNKYDLTDSSHVTTSIDEQAHVIMPSTDHGY